MTRTTNIFLATGLFGLVLAMIVSLSALPNGLIAVGYFMMFLGAFGAIISSAVARGFAKPSRS